MQAQGLAPLTITAHPPSQRNDSNNSSPVGAAETVSQSVANVGVYVMPMAGSGAASTFGSHQIDPFAQKGKQTQINYKARAISGTAPIGGGYIDLEFEILNVDGTTKVNFSGSVLTTNMGVGLDLSFVESEGVLTGPHIAWAKSAVIEALDGQLVTGDGFTFSIGNGVVVGGDFDIGPYTDPDSTFQVKGVSVGWEGFRGSLNLDQDSFSVPRMKK